MGMRNAFLRIANAIVFANPAALIGAAAVAAVVALLVWVAL